MTVLPRWLHVQGFITKRGDVPYVGLQVWDSFGRLLYQSSPFDYAVTAVAWCPSGDLFAVGTFNNLLLCDRMGWAYSKVCAINVLPTLLSCFKVAHRSCCESGTAGF